MPILERLSLPERTYETVVVNIGESGMRLVRINVST